MMSQHALLESYLKSLRLPTFVENFRKFADDAAQNDQDYTRYLQALAEQEVIRREQNRLRRLIRNAKFPVQKELADFDFSAIPSLNRQRVLTLAQGQYIEKRESLLLIGPQDALLDRSRISQCLAGSPGRTPVASFHCPGLEVGSGRH